MVGLGWSAIQARLRDPQAKKFTSEEADVLYDMVENSVTSESLATLSVLFELQPAVAAELLGRKAPNRTIVDCAVLTWLRSVRQPADKKAIEAVVRNIMYAQKNDERSTADLIREVFKGQQTNATPVEEAERLRKVRVLSIAFTYHPDLIPTGVKKADLISILTTAAQDSREEPEHQFIAAESARAFRKLLVPSKETSVAKIAESFNAVSWNGRKLDEKDASGSLDFPAGTRWIAVQHNPPQAVRCEAGCLSIAPILIEAESGFAIFGLIPISDSNARPRAKFSIVHPARVGFPGRPPTAAVASKMDNLPEAGNLIESPTSDVGSISVLPISHGLRVPKIDGGIFDMGALPLPQKYLRWKLLTDEDKDRMRFATVLESKDPAPEVKLSFPNLTYARAFDEALRPGGALTERGRHESIEVGGYRSLARLQLLFDAANQHENSENLVAVSRSAFLRQALPVAALELSQRYLPDLEQQVLQVATTLGKVKEAHRLVSNGRKSFAELTNESAFALLGYAADSLSIEKPNVVKDKQQLEVALTGAEEQLRNLVVELSEKKIFICELLKELEFPGTRLLPAMKIDEKVVKVCAEK